MNKVQLFLKRHSSTILTVASAAGVVATTVLAVKATPKALQLIEDEKQSRKKYSDILDDDCSYETVLMPELKPMEVVKIAWKPYIPAMISGISTITCIFGAHYLSTKSQASLISAYALLDNSYKEYRHNTKKSCPEESPIFEHEIIKSKFNNDIEIGEDEELFYDYQSMRYFSSTFDKVKEAESKLNEKLSTDGFACLNDFYDILGIEHVPYGYQLGWSTVKSDETYGKPALDFDYDVAEIAEGLEANIITINYPSSLEYIC